MRIVTTADALRDELGGRACAFVPTMGALHNGHATLVRRGAAIASREGLAGGCVVSIFVNPTQFNDPADLTRYPRTPDADARVCRDADASLIFAPTPDEVYPPGRPVMTPPLPPVAAGPGLEDSSRPGHFAGVCQVVLRLFDLVTPHVAVFGEKDWQQLQTVRALARVHAPGLRIEAGETVREADGLAMSSRNRFLTAEDRARALAISRALRASQRAGSPASAEAVMREELALAGIHPEYAVVRDAETLLEWTPGRPGRALIAARVGAVRLIDNAPWVPHVAPRGT